MPTMASHLHFPLATEADACAISALILRLVPTLTTDPEGRGAAAFLATLTPEAIAANLRQESFRYHLAWAGPELAGAIGLREACHVFHLFVAADRQRQGIATRLWQLARAAALTAGNPGQFTVKATPAAVTVYERFGFRACGEPIERNGVKAIPMGWSDPGPAEAAATGQRS
jgi:GNAT superfamily N-acetyltransferase